LGQPAPTLSVNPSPFYVVTPSCDAAGNLLDDRRPGGHGYMLDLAEWHGMGYELEPRFRELELACERWDAERSFLGHFVATCLCPCVPGLRALYRRRHRADVWRCQVVELANHVAVFKTLLELERDLNDRLRERNRRSERTAA
jgi:hypothetical protein